MQTPGERNFPATELQVGFSFTTLDHHAQFGTLRSMKPDTADSEFRPSSKGLGTSELHPGLGYGPGGQLARSCLVTTGASLLEQSRQRKARSEEVSSAVLAKSDKLEALPTEPPPSPRPSPTSASAVPVLGPGGEPQGMFMALILGEDTPVTEKELAQVRSHRWTFKGADTISAQGRGFCSLVLCLLDLTRGVQLMEDGDVLDLKLARACKAFVSGRCRQGRAGDMYHLLGHFLSNSPVFHEWARYLHNAFHDSRANQEGFIVPHLEQVWTRYVRLRTALEGVFGVLNERFCWKHRLPKVGDLVHEHMRRRCFTSEAIARNELFQQSGVIRDETLKQVKFAFGFG